MGTGTLPRPMIDKPYTQGISSDFNRAGAYASWWVQEMMKSMFLDQAGAPQSGFFGTGFKIVADAGGGDGWDVRASVGLGYQYDATGSAARVSNYRSLMLEAEKTVQINGGNPPAALTNYYVHVKWNTVDGEAENRLVRPGAGQNPVPTPGCNTTHIQDPTFLVSPNASEVGYLALAKVAVPAAPAHSGDYTITDLRSLLWSKLITRVLSSGVEKTIELKTLSAAGSAGYAFLRALGLQIGPEQADGARLQIVPITDPVEGTTAISFRILADGDPTVTSFLTIHSNGNIEFLDPPSYSEVLSGLAASGEGGPGGSSAGYWVVTVAGADCSIFLPLKHKRKATGASGSCLNPATVDVHLQSIGGGTVTACVKQLNPATEVVTPVSDVKTWNNTESASKTLTINGDYVTDAGNPIYVEIICSAGDGVRVYSYSPVYVKTWEC